jgi:hypothetical protein
MRKLVTWSALALLALPGMALSQVSDDLARQLESRQELAMDYGILQARLKNNAAEYTLGNFCAPNGLVGLTKAAQDARRAYCAKKTTDFNSRDADLRSQLQTLGVTIQQLDVKIADMRRASQTPKPRP